MSLDEIRLPSIVVYAILYVFQKEASTNELLLSRKRDKVASDFNVV